MALYNLRMRASKNGEAGPEHVSGAEKIVSESDVKAVAAALVERAMQHPRGKPDEVNVRVQRLDESTVLRLKALKVTTVEVETAEAGLKRAQELLESAGIANAKKILALLPLTFKMRGAMLLDVHDLERLEPDKARGVRATCMDYARGNASAAKSAGSNSHFKEALVLATKVLSHKNICGEICVSDDPDYVTGYVTAGALGYTRITKLKELGSPNGGRIFLYSGPKSEVAECIRYLQETPVLVEENDG